MRLTEQQLNHFRTFGFLIFRQLLSAEEIQRVSAEVDATVDRWAPIGRYQDQRKNTYVNLLDRVTSPFSASLLDDPRFADIAPQLLGKDVLGIEVDARYFMSLFTNWHPDGGPELPGSDRMEYTGLKFTLYLEPLNATNGALRVLPGSHRDPYWSTLRRQFQGNAPRGSRQNTEEAFGVHLEEMPAYVFESQPGDVLVFELPLWHASFGGGSRRRQATVVFYEDPRTPEAATAVQQVMRRNHQGHAQWQGDRPMFGADFRSNPDPRHQLWVHRLAELGILNAPTEAVSAGG